MLALRLEQRDGCSGRAQLLPAALHPAVVEGGRLWGLGYPLPCSPPCPAGCPRPLCHCGDMPREPGSLQLAASPRCPWFTLMDFAPSPWASSALISAIGDSSGTVAPMAQNPPLDAPHLSCSPVVVAHPPSPARHRSVPVGFAVPAWGKTPKESRGPLQVVKFPPKRDVFGAS